MRQNKLTKKKANKPMRGRGLKFEHVLDASPHLQKLLALQQTKKKIKYPPSKHIRNTNIQNKKYLNDYISVNKKLKHNKNKIQTFKAILFQKRLYVDNFQHSRQTGLPGNYISLDEYRLMKKMFDGSEKERLLFLKNNRKQLSNIVKRYTSSIGSLSKSDLLNEYIDVLENIIQLTKDL
tara:strand:+ start:1209 stop:1745 length:537 start_codon:yes stop_codon:yes gene_type:complete